MAEESKGPGPIADAFFIIGLLVVIGIVWVASGGPARSSLKGIFLNPPPPLGNGQSYGPQLGTTTPIGSTTPVTNK